MAPGEPDPVEGWFAVDAAGRVARIGAGAVPAGVRAETELDAAGKIITPGFVSAHSHLWSAPFRGIASESTLYGWIAAAHSPFSPYYEEGDFYTFTQYGGLDFLSHGITTNYNWVNNYGYDYEHWMEQFEAQLSLQQRFIPGWAIDVTASEAVNRKRLAAFLKQGESLKKKNSHLLGLSLSALGLLRGDTEFPFWEGRMMQDFDLDAQAHYLEAPDIISIQQKQFSILEDSGMLSDKLHFAHFIHTDDQILEKTVAAGTRMVWNPLSNGRLASGLADIPRYQRAGLRVGMGLDGQASGDLSDPFENMRMGLYATRMRYQSAAIMTPYQILAMHTLGSAAVLNVDDRVGSLEVGKFADFLVLDPREPDAGPVFDIYATVVLSLSTRNLASVFVGGEAVVRDGEILSHDFPAIRDAAHARVERMLGQLAQDGQPVPQPTYKSHYRLP
ncbi:MAG: amidohydrolase family protein [Halieaceae bacterium]|jgi:cytosine/adenosine deaminase-related metal-dependent hydrolase|nr:amidohydrolase family protein [Halieaceae bacterium]